MAFLTATYMSRTLQTLSCVLHIQPLPSVQISSEVQEYLAARRAATVAANAGAECAVAFCPCSPTLAADAYDVQGFGASEEDTYRAATSTHACQGAERALHHAAADLQDLPGYVRTCDSSGSPQDLCPSGV